MSISQLNNNFINISIKWIKENSQDKEILKIVNEITEKNENNNIIWHLENKFSIIYNYNENIYKMIISNIFYENNNLSNFDYIKKSDYCEIIINDKNIIIKSTKPDFICMIIFLLKPNDLSNITGSIFNKNKLNKNNPQILNLLETKSYSLIISRYNGRNQNHFELSFYKLLKLIYDNEKLFEFGVKYLILDDNKLSKSQIKYFNSYVKLKSNREYTFMHKYILKTPKYVIKKILSIEKLDTYLGDCYSIRYEEKNFILKLESNNITNKNIFVNSNIILLYKIFVIDEIKNHEYNVFNLYLNKTNGFNIIEKVIFNIHLKIMIEISNYFIKWANKNINLYHKFDENNIVTYNYLDWYNNYFCQNINNYLKK